MPFSNSFGGMKANVRIIIVSGLVLINVILLISIIIVKTRLCLKDGNLRSTINSRIIEGKPVVNAGKYPFVVGLGRIIFDDQIDLVCGATITSKHWALSAAHCKDYLLITKNVDEEDMVILANSTEYLKGVIHELDKFVSYEPDASDSDIVLIRVIQPFINAYEKPINVAGNGYTYSRNKIVTVMGWGFTDRDIPLASEILNEVNVQLYAHGRCKNIIANAPIRDLPVFTKRFFCAGPERKRSNADACRVDSGGAVVDKNLLIGIVSWGIQDREIKCGIGYPGIYVSVWKYESWIHSVEEKQKEKIASFKRKPS